MGKEDKKVLTNLDLAMVKAFSELEKFQDQLRNDRPKNWIRDEVLIENLKKTLSKLYNQLKDIQNERGSKAAQLS